MERSDIEIEAIEFVSNLTGVPSTDILSVSREDDVIVSRHLFRYYLKMNSKMTLKEIGAATFSLNAKTSRHAIAIHSVKTVNSCATYDRTYKRYKEAIDNKELDLAILPRVAISRILRRQMNNQMKCNALLELFKTEEDESDRTSKQRSA